MEILETLPSFCFASCMRTNTTRKKYVNHKASDIAPKGVKYEQGTHEYLLAGGCVQSWSCMAAV